MIEPDDIYITTRNDGEEHLVTASLTLRCRKLVHGLAPASECALVRAATWAARNEVWHHVYGDIRDDVEQLKKLVRTHLNHPEANAKFERILTKLHGPE